MQLNNKLVEDFLQEAIILRQFNHPNILPLCGVSVHEDKPCVILPLMSNGDLDRYLKNHSEVIANTLNCNLDCKSFMSICNAMYCHKMLM